MEIREMLSFLPKSFELKHFKLPVMLSHPLSPLRLKSIFGKMEPSLTCLLLPYSSEVLYETSVKV